jgi:hypothetical protein
MTTTSVLTVANTIAAQREYARAWRKRNPEKTRASRINYRTKHSERYRQQQKTSREQHAASERERQNKWRKMNPDKVHQQNKRYARRHPEHRISQYVACNAVVAGILVKPSRCTQCRKLTNDLEKHHPDYNKPLAVMWLCYPCHLKKHGAKVRTWKPVIEKMTGLALSL